VSSRPRRWSFWTVYAAGAAAYTLMFAIGTSILVEEILEYRDQQRGSATIDECFDRLERRYEVAGDYSIAAIFLAIAAFAFLAFMIKKYFAPRLNAAL